MGDQQNSRRTVSQKAARRQEKAASPGRSVNMDELRELIGLLRDNGLAEFELEQEGFRVRLRRDVDFSEAAAPAHNSPAPAAPPPRSGAASAPAPAATAATVPVHPGAQAETAASEDQSLHIIPSPIVGTFYRSASPNAEPFVKIGTHVAPDSVVCIIEAMKLMNEIQAETSGEVAKIYVENGQPVEYGQPLFGISR